MSTRQCNTQGGGKPAKGVNTVGRNSAKGGVNKKRNDNINHAEEMGQLNRAQKEKIAKENKRIAEGKLILKRKLREAALLLDIEMGIVRTQIDDDENDNEIIEKEIEVADDDNENDNENEIIDKEIEVGEMKDETVSDNDEIKIDVASSFKSPSSDA
jgi:hypothetical protein